MGLLRREGPPATRAPSWRTPRKVGFAVAVVLLVVVSGLSAVDARAAAATVGAAPTSPGATIHPVRATTERVEVPAPTRTVTPAVPPATGPSWPTFLMNGQRTAANLQERTLAASNISNLTLLWSKTVNQTVGSSPSYANGMIFVGTWSGYEESVYPANGTIKWATKLGFNSNCYVGGIDSSPTIVNGMLYVGGSDDYWYALNASNGTILWKTYIGDVANGNENWASPLIYGKFAYIGVASCSDSPLVWGRLLQVNLTGNHTVNHTFAVVPKTQLGGSIWATPAVDPVRNLIWVATGNDNGVDVQPLAQSIVALRPNNLTRVGSWQVPNVQGYDDDFGATPTIINDSHGRTLIIDTNKNGILYALNASNATTNGSWKPVWQVVTGNIYAPATFDGRTVYTPGTSVVLHGVSYSASLWAIDPDNGSVRWRAGLNSSFLITGTIAYANGLLFFPGGDFINVYNATNGRLLYAYSFKGAIAGCPILGSITVVAGQVITGCGNEYSSGGLLDLGLPLGGNLSAGTSGGDAPLSVPFLANISGGVPPYSVNWSFGDGTWGSGSSTTHQYTRGGSFNVTGNVTDSIGETFSSVVTVTVLNPMTATFTALPRTVGVVPLTVTFDAVPEGGNAHYRYLWTFGDGSSPAMTSSALHTFVTSGSYPVNVTVSDTAGGEVHGSFVVSVSKPLALTANANVVAGDVPMNVSLTSTPLFGIPPYHYVWTFSDGAASVTTENASRTLTTPGFVTATVAVSDSLNEEKTQSFNLTAYPAPTVEFTTTPAGSTCSTNSSTFDFSAVPRGGLGPYTFSWKYGDGTNSSGSIATATHSYVGTQQFSVSLTLTDSFGVTASTGQLLNVTAPDCGGHHIPTGPGGPQPGGGGGGLTSDELVEIGIFGGAAAAAVGLAVVLFRGRRASD